MVMVDTFLGYPIKKNANGYPYITIDGRDILCHRIMAELSTRRALKKDEVVHHINRVRSDFRPENLMVFANQEEHMNYHHGGQLWFDQEGVAHALPPLNPSDHFMKHHYRKPRKFPRFGR